MIRTLRLLAALATALVLGAMTLQPALAATRTSGPTPGPDQTLLQISLATLIGSTVTLGVCSLLVRLPR